jgi:hypothetical protein
VTVPGTVTSKPAGQAAAHLAIPFTQISVRAIVWRMRGEIQQLATYPQVSSHMTAVCKAVGFATQVRTLDLPGQLELAFHRQRRGGVVA